MFLKNWIKPWPTSLAEEGSRFALKTDQRVKAFMTFCGPWQMMIRIQAATVSYVLGTLAQLGLTLE